jgi:hypothetical protein
MTFNKTDDENLDVTFEELGPSALNTSFHSPPREIVNFCNEILGKIGVSPVRAARLCSER